MAGEDNLKQAIPDIEQEMQDQIAYFKRENRLLEAQRIEQRTMYDLEMLREVGYCSGIENYSRHLDQRRGRLAALDVDGLPAQRLSAVPG